MHVHSKDDVHVHYVYISTLVVKTLVVKTLVVKTLVHSKDDVHVHSQTASSRNTEEHRGTRAETFKGRCARALADSAPHTSTNE